MTISPVASQKIKNMALLCAILIVTIHVNWTASPSFAGKFMREYVACGIARIGVPFFFLISGFFYARHFCEEGWWFREVKKRLWTLLVPYLAWTVINLIIILSLNIIADFKSHREFGTSLQWLYGNTWMEILGLDLTRGPLLGPLWYVRCLMIFVVFGWVFKVALAHIPYLWIGMCVLLDIYCKYMPAGYMRDILTNGMYLGGLATGLLYFSVGIGSWLSCIKCGISLPPLLRCLRLSFVWTVLGITLLAISMFLSYKKLPLNKDVLQLSIPFLIYGVYYYMPSKCLPEWLTKSAFPIFLMNIIVASCLRLVIEMLKWHNFFVYALVFFAATFCPIAFFVLARYYLPRVSSILFGGRC